MPAPTFNLAVKGAAPNQYATELDLEAELNRTLSETWNGFTANDSAVLRDAGVVTLTNVTGSGNAITAEFPAALVPMIGATIPNRLFVGFVSPVTTTGPATLAIGADVVDLRQAGGLPLTEAINLTAGEFIVFERWGGAWRLRFGDASLPRVTRMVGDEAAARLELADRVDTTEAAQATLTDTVAEKADGGAMFHRGSSDGTVIIADEGADLTILSLDEAGQPRAPFASSAEVANKVGLGYAFHTSPDSGVIPVIAAEGPEGDTVILSVDGDGNQITPWRQTFFLSADYSFAEVDENGIVFRAWDESGRQIIPAQGSGDVDFTTLSVSSQYVLTGEPWALHGSVRVQRKYDDFFTGAIRTMLPDTAGVYSLYDDLLAAYPEYIAMAVIGQDAFGNDLREYVFTPDTPAYVTGWSKVNDLTFPTIVLETGIHGDEKEAILSGYLLARELCERWREEDRLERLRWGCRLVIVPVVNPSGCNAHTRNNGADINLNREGKSDPMQPEAAIVVQLPVRYPEACGFIDAHNMWGFNSDETSFWLALQRREDLGIALDVTRRMAGYESREFDFMPQEWVNKTGITVSVDSGIVANWVTHHGARAYVMETPGLRQPTVANRPHMRRHNLEGYKTLITALFDAELRKREISM